MWLYIASNFDVYPSFTGIWPAFRLGNLKQDGVAGVLDTLEHDRTPGLHVMFHTPTAGKLAHLWPAPRAAAVRHGDSKWRWVTLRARAEEKERLCDS